MSVALAASVLLPWDWRLVSDMALLALRAWPMRVRTVAACGLLLLGGLGRHDFHWPFTRDLAAGGGLTIVTSSPSHRRPCFCRSH